MSRRASLVAAAPISLGVHLLVLASMDPVSSEGWTAPPAPESWAEVVSLPIEPVGPVEPVDTAPTEAPPPAVTPSQPRTPRATRARSAPERGAGAAASHAELPTAPTMPAWMRRNIGDPRWVVTESDSLLGDTRLSAPLSIERHADGTLTFRGDGVEGCRYPDGTIQTRADSGEDPCCHADSIDDCGCPIDDSDAADRAAVLEQLERQL